MADHEERLDVKRFSFTDFALLAIVVSALTYLWISTTFEAALATIWTTRDSAASEDSEIKQIEAKVEADAEIQINIQEVKAPEQGAIIWAEGRITCIQFWGFNRLVNGFTIEVGGLAEVFMAKGLHRHGRDIMFMDPRFGYRPMSITYGGRWDTRGVGSMHEVYTQLITMSGAAMIQYRTEEREFYRSIFEQSVDVADYASLLEAGENRCSICLEVFESSPCGKPLSETHVAVEVKCGQRHIFGANCVWEWVRGCRDSARDRGCPVCCNKLEIPNSRWDADENWVRIHLEQRRRLKQRRRENSRGHVKDPQHDLKSKILMTELTWSDLLVDTIAALEISGSDRGLVKALKNARTLLRAFSSLTDREQWPREADRNFVVSFTECRTIDVHIVRRLRREFTLYKLLCCTIEHLSIMGQGFSLGRELSTLD